MSSVKIQGSATGTANFTIAVPDGTSTDRTIELPDSAGSFVLADGSNNVAVSGDLTVDTNTLHVDSANNRVGIGTSSPTTTKLQIDYSAAAENGLRLHGTNTGQNNAIQMYDASNNYVTHGINAGAYTLAINGSERASINSNGTQTLDATHTSGYSLTITNSASSGVPEGIDIVNSGISVDSQAGHFIRMRDLVYTRCVIDLNGSLRNHDNSYGAISDQRAKQEIVDASSQWDDIKAIQVRKYKKTVDVESYGDDAQLEIGVIAQELEASGMGGLVNTPDNPDEMKSVKYSILYMKAVKALQEAMERIETLETKVAALEAV